MHGGRRAGTEDESVVAGAEDTGSPWRVPPAELHLMPGEVHLWLTDITQIHGDAESDAVLSPDEVARARRFIAPEARHRFVVGRVTLRRILSRYSGLHPGLHRFHMGRYGKPELRASGSGGGLSFNLSHSGSLVLCAVTLDGPVGIDVECLHPVPHAADIVQSYFSRGEAAAFEVVPLPQQMETFLRWWVLKEAYMKGLGLGHSLTLNSFDVLSGWGLADGWQIRPLLIRHGYVAALAVRGFTPTLHYWNWPA